MNRERTAWEQEAANLDRVADVPTDLLAETVARDGKCWWEITDGDPPPVVSEEPDRELAARLCAGCPVWRECLELELRTAGTDTVGVWGALSEDDRRALHPVWSDRRNEQDEQTGGAS